MAKRSATKRRTQRPTPATKTKETKAANGIHFVGTLGSPQPHRLPELWDRNAFKPKDNKEVPKWVDPGPRTFALCASPEFTLYCDPDAPLRHMGAVVVLYEKRPLFWAYMKTKHPDKAKVLRIGWPDRRAGMRYNKKDSDAGWQVVPVVKMGRMTLK